MARFKGYHDLQVRRWILKHRGVLSQIACMREVGCTPQFVQQVAYGITTARANQGTRAIVERKLREMDWPGSGR